MVFLAPAPTSSILTRLDTVAHIVSGTFEGTLVGNGKPNMQITDGRFNVVYTK
ncbi:MAG: hypothetical protein ACRYFX_30155 [Janthinobacterium lividum]